MGNQGHSSEGAALINEWIQAGLIGPVKEVHAWTNRPIWPQGIPRPSRVTVVADSPVQQTPGAVAGTGATQGGGAGASGGGGGAGSGNNWNSRLVAQTLATAMAGDVSIPAGLDWDLFLGPAPEVLYHPIYHPFNWRGWFDWGTGAIGDMAAHLIDHPYWALGLRYPTSVEATSTPWGTDGQSKPASYPLSSQIVYRFP